MLCLWQSQIEWLRSRLDTTTGVPSPARTIFLVFRRPLRIEPARKMRLKISDEKLDFEDASGAVPLEIFDDGGSMIFVEGRRLFAIALSFRRFLPSIT